MNRYIFGLLILATICSIAFASQSFSNRACLRRTNYFRSSIGLYNTCSCDLQVQYTLVSGGHTTTNVTRVPAWTGTSTPNNWVQIAPATPNYTELVIGGTIASKSECFPHLWTCLTGFPNYSPSGTVLLNQCSADIAVQIPVGSSAVFTYPVYLPAWNGDRQYQPNQIPNNGALLPFTLSVSFGYPFSSSGFGAIPVIQKSKSKQSADDSSFSLF